MPHALAAFRSFRILLLLCYRYIIYRTSFTYFQNNLKEEKNVLTLNSLIYKQASKKNFIGIKWMKLIMKNYRCYIEISFWLLDYNHRVPGVKGWMPCESSRHQLSISGKVSAKDCLSRIRGGRAGNAHSRCPHVNNRTAKIKRVFVIGFHGGSRARQKGD